MEIWGLACHPTKPEYCTVGDDQTVRVWCLLKKIQLRVQRLECVSRACALTDTADIVAVGFGGRNAVTGLSKAAQAKTGGIALLCYSDLTKKVFEDRPSKQAISEMKFSPNGAILAVGSHDHKIYLYRIERNATKVVKTATFDKHQSYITHLDFSADSQILQSNCGAYELLFSNASTGKHITSASSTKDAQWHSWTCVLGWPVQGIWPSCSDGTDVNAVARSSREDLLATSDDFGLVKLYRYPCVAKNASSLDHRGHSSHVTNVRWSHDDSYVISIGGNDRAVMEWKVVGENDRLPRGPEKQLSLLEAEEATDSSVESEEESFDDPTGDEFMAVKPWLGAIVAPTNAAAPNSREPDLRVELEWVYGYQSELSQQNLVYNAQDEVVYHTAAVGIIYDSVNHLQKHHVGHNDDIISFALCDAKRNLIATGERGKKPAVRVWDAHTGEMRCEMKEFHTRGILSLAFSSDSARLVSVGDDDDHSLAVWSDASNGSWTLAKLLATSKGDKAVNHFACFGPNADTIITGGVKHVLFWSVQGKTLASKKGVVGKKGTLQTFPTGCNFGGDFVTGTAGGELYVWRGSDLSRIVKAHQGEVRVVSSTSSTDNPAVNSSVLLSGGKDGRVVMWNSTYQSLKSFDLEAMHVGSFGRVINSVFLNSTGKKLLVGTCCSDIIEIDVTSGGVLNGGQPLFSGHFAMELWGLAVHPSQREFVTVGDDRTLRVWDMDAKRLIQARALPAKARACAYSPNAELLAVGFGGDNGVRQRRKAPPKQGQAQLREGGFAVLRSRDLDTEKTVFEDKPAKEWISDVKFSPCGNILALGSHDNSIYLYSVGAGASEFKKRKPFSKHNSYITHFDFSEDSSYIQSNCGAYEYLFCDTASSSQVSRASSVRDVKWATWTCTLGWPVQGIWPDCADGTDINAVSASASRTILATGDDSGNVKLFRYPCIPKGVRGVWLLSFLWRVLTHLLSAFTVQVHRVSRPLVARGERALQLRRQVCDLSRGQRQVDFPVEAGVGCLLPCSAAQAAGPFSHALTRSILFKPSQWRGSCFHSAAFTSLCF
jgi:microtubule-associated protein-like 6